MAITKITGASIAADSIDGTKIADDAINSEHITDGGVDNVHIGDLAATKLTGTIASGRLSAANLGSGTVPTARLGSGTADNTKFLRGDNTWQVVAGTTTRIHAFSKSANKLIWTHTASSLSLKDGNNSDSYLHVEIGSSDQVYSISSDGKLICTYT